MRCAPLAPTWLEPDDCRSTLMGEAGKARREEGVPTRSIRSGIRLVAVLFASAAISVVGSQSGYAHGGHGGSSHPPVHGPGSSHNPIVYHPVHGPGSSHNPIVYHPVH